VATANSNPLCLRNGELRRHSTSRHAPVRQPHPPPFAHLRRLGHPRACCQIRLVLGSTPLQGCLCPPRLAQEHAGFPYDARHSCSPPRSYFVGRVNALVISCAASSQGVTATTCRRHLPIDSLAENISWAIMNLLNRDPGNIDPDSQFVKDWEKDYERWCARVSAKLGNKFRWSVEMKQALAGVVCCSSPTPSNISNLNSAASVACISGRMPTRSTVAIIGNRFEKFRHCQALSAVARPSLDGIRCLQAPLKST
jgi:hypothetical protein